MQRRAQWIAAALLASVAAGACGGDRAAAPSGSVGAAATAVPEPQLTTLAELRVAVERNLQRGALVSFWATW